MENSNTPWTPGPWWAEPSRDEYENGRAIIAARTDCGPLPGNPTRGMVAFTSELLEEKESEYDANARLIAAAPEMAAFIQKYVDAWRSGTGTVYLIDEAEAILASIEGKS